MDTLRNRIYANLITRDARPQAHVAEWLSSLSPDGFTITASEPTQSFTRLHMHINGNFLEIDLPEGPYAGRSISHTIAL